MATCSTTSTYTNILDLPQVTNIEAGNFLIIQTEDTTNIIDFENFLIPLENTTFGSTISSHSIDILNMQTTINDLSATISRGVQYLNDPKTANIRLSLDRDNPIVNSDITNAGTLYIHPYKGGEISLYNATSATWTLYTLTSAIATSLSQLAANTTYDVFIGVRDNQYRVAFNSWPSQDAGNTTVSRKYINGVTVADYDEELRFIGCIRTVAAGQSEQTFGRAGTIGGSHPKQFVWNAQHRVPVTCYNWEPASYTVTTNTGWRKLNAGATGGGSNNRFSFVVGEATYVDAVGQLYASAPSDTGSYVSFVVNNSVSNDPNVPEVTISEFFGTICSPVSHLKKSFNTGYHFCQMVEQFYSAGVTTTINSDNRSNQTGFIVNLEA